MCLLSSEFAAASAGVNPRSEPFGSFAKSYSATCCPSIAPKGTVATRADHGDARPAIQREPKAAMFLRRRYCSDELS